MLSIIYSKFLYTLSEMSLSDIFRAGSRLSLSFVLLILLVNTRGTLENFAMALKWHDFVILKVFVSFFIVFGFSLWHKFIMRCMDSLSEYIASFFPGEDQPLFYGIPCIELVDYLFENDTFSRAEVEKTFGISRSTFDEIAKKLDEVSVFTRGPNNARVLNSDFSRADIYSILSKGEVRPLHRKVSETRYTHEPSMPSILSRSGFTTRPLHSGNRLG